MTSHKKNHPERVITLLHSGMDKQLIVEQTDQQYTDGVRAYNDHPRNSGMVFQLLIHGCFLANACYGIAHSQDFYPHFVICGSPGNEARQYCVVLEDS